MEIEFFKIYDGGNLARERISLLNKGVEIDIGLFTLLQGRTSETGKACSGRMSNAYWFPNQKIKNGDFVTLYTKGGTRSEKKNDNGTTSYFFYWHLKSPIWIKGSTPLLLYSPLWEYGNPCE